MKYSAFDPKEMGQKLVKLRGDKTLEEVSKAIGISKSALSMYEQGNRVPRDPVKLRLAQYYNRSVPFIFFTEKEHEV